MLTAAFAGTALATLGTVPAVAAPPAVTGVVGGLAATLFASAPPMSPGTTAVATNPDDITQMGGVVYVTFQNNAGKDGAPQGSFSTIAAYRAHDGSLLRTYQVRGRCDGLTADPRRHRLLASVNEDNNSSLFVIRPDEATPTHYTYRPDPGQVGSDGTNGGTDAISVGQNGTLYVAHSNPDMTLPAPNNPPAVYTMTLHAATATLTPLFGVNDTATIINPAPGGPHTAPMALTDPDSNRYLRLDGGTLAQVAQGDSKIVFATHLHSATPTLRQLLLTNAAPTSSGQPATPQLDDLARIDGPGKLLVVDQKGDAIYSVDTRAVPRGTVFVSQPAPSAGDLPNNPALATVDLSTGVVTHVLTGFVSPKGLLVLRDHPTRDDKHDSNDADEVGADK